MMMVMMVMMVMVMVMVMMMIIMMMMMMKHGWPGNSHVEEEDHLQTGSSIKGFGIFRPDSTNSSSWKAGNTENHVDSLR